MSNFTDPNRLGISGKVLAACRAQGRAAFVGYLPVGYPDVAKSCEAYRVLCEGADMVEIGMPYSDPFLDGPVIQHATTRALARGVRPARYSSRKSATTRSSNSSDRSHT